MRLGREVAEEAIEKRRWWRAVGSTWTCLWGRVVVVGSVVMRRGSGRLWWRRRRKMVRRRKMSKRKSLILGFGFLKILLNEMRAITELPASTQVFQYPVRWLLL